jgi:hypothetical protein
MRIQALQNKTYITPTLKQKAKKPQVLYKVIQVFKLLYDTDRTGS